MFTSDAICDDGIRKESTIEEGDARCPYCKQWCFEVVADDEKVCVRCGGIFIPKKPAP